MAVRLPQAEDMLKSIFGNEWLRLLDMRSLQSIALQLNLNIDLEKLNKDTLRIAIGYYLHSNPLQTNKYKESLIIIAKNNKIDTGVFDFLCENYGVKLIVAKINEFNVFGVPVGELIFHNGHHRRVVLNYISDTCGKNNNQIYIELDKLKRNLESMGFYKKKFDWFKDEDGEEGVEKMRAAVDFFSKGVTMGLLIRDIEDLEVYFLDSFVDGNMKENSFYKICSLYNNRKTRRKTKKKQCNFSLGESTIRYIDAMAKSSGISRSELLERVFRSKNSKGLLELIQ